MRHTIEPAQTAREDFKKQLPAFDYMLVLSPHEDLANRIRDQQKEFARNYELPLTLSGKPHLTIVRFKQIALLEERILGRLRTIAMGYNPFKVELKDYGSLPTHSIFINVTSKMPIKGLVTQIRDVQRLMKMDKENKPHFIEDPHLIIARKLQPWQYEKGWLEYSHKHFTARFIADGMLLLKRREGDKAWQIVEKFAFQNMPVTTKQGQLFG